MFFEDKLTKGTGSLGICCLWTPQAKMREVVTDFALLGNLYSTEGISFLLRNLLLCPEIHTLIVCGKDLTKTGDALLRLFSHGLDEESFILGTDIKIHPQIDRGMVSLLCNQLRVVDFRSIPLSQLGSPCEVYIHAVNTRQQMVCSFPYEIPVVTAFPATMNGIVVHCDTLSSTYLELLWKVLTFGEYIPGTRELRNVTAVLNDTVTEYETWMPFTYDTYAQYCQQLLTTGDGSTAYHYGARLQGGEGYVNQIETLVTILSEDTYSRRAFATTWRPYSDPESESPPCLVTIQADIRNDQLHLTAMFRSHDGFRAWLLNAFSLRELQRTIAYQLQLPPGDLTIISHSLHIYHHDGETAQRLVDTKRRSHNPRFMRDPHGAWVIEVTDRIVAHHYSPSGEHLQDFHGISAHDFTRSLIPFVGNTYHAFYLGRELVKAQRCLEQNIPYIQDTA